MKRVFACSFTVWLLASAIFAQAAAPPPPATQAAPKAKWEAEIRKFEDADRRDGLREGCIIFFGSSSIRKWGTLAQDFPALPVLNRGFGGSQLSDAALYAERVVVPHKPRMVVIYAGDNDLAQGKEPEQVFGDYKRLVEGIHERLPETRIAYISIKPSIKRWQLVGKIRAVNDLIRQYAASDRRQAYIDIFTPMLGADGLPRKELFVKDGLHLSPAGYALWRDAVAPLLK